MEKTRKQLPKSPTGIQGLDEITGGGLPKGRPTLVCGPTGCGKTLLAMEFLVRGATQFNEPGVFMAFEETAKDLTQNVASLGFDLKDLVARKKIVLDHVFINPGETEESGEYNLDGLFIRLGQAIDSIGAKRVVLDTIESLFSGLSNQHILRSELRTPVPLAERQGCDCRHHRRTRRWHADAPRVGRVRFRLCDRAGPSRRQPDLLAAAAGGQVPRLNTRYERVPLPDRRRRHFGAADHLARFAGNCLNGAHLIRRSAPGCHAGRSGLLPGQQHCWFPAQPVPAKPAWPFFSPRRPAGAASAPCIFPSRNRPARSSAICARSGSTCNRGWKKACCSSRPTGRPLPVSKCMC
jgi:hypothetical protein